MIKFLYVVHKWRHGKKQGFGSVLAVALRKNVLGAIGSKLDNVLFPKKLEAKKEEERLALEEKLFARNLELRAKFYEEAFLRHERERNEQRRQRRTG